MDPEAQQGTEEATPDTGTPETPVIDWEKRYNDLRPQYDRMQNEANRYNDPEQRRQLFAEMADEYGYAIDEGEQEYESEYVDPTDVRSARLEAELTALRQEWQNYTQQQQQQAAIAVAEAYSEDKLDELGITNEKQREWIVSRATAMPALQVEGQVVPDIEAAHREYAELMSFERSTWAQSKSDIPHTPAGGVENTGVPAWSDDPVERAAQRQAYMLERYRANQG